MTLHDDLATLRSLLSYIAADSLDVPVVYPDGRTALDVQVVEMGEVSAWFAECRVIVARVEAELSRLREERDGYKNVQQIALAEKEAAEAALAARDDYSRKTGCDCHENSTVDPDYSPVYQDEYQRLWHRDAAALADVRRALEQIAAMTHAANAPNIARRALAATDGDKEAT